MTSFHHDRARLWPVAPLKSPASGVKKWLWRRRRYILCACAILAVWHTPTFLTAHGHLSSPSIASSHLEPQNALLNSQKTQSDHFQPQVEVDKLPQGGLSPDQQASPPNPPTGNEEASHLHAPSSVTTSDQDTGPIPQPHPAVPDSAEQRGSSNPTETPYTFPTYSEWLDLDSIAETLPDLVHIPFEDAVAREVLEGWEDDWFAHAHYDFALRGPLKEPKIDFVYTWVNGSDDAFARTMRPYEENSTLNDADGEWIGSHGSNRYRSWDELRYSIRSVEKFASEFRHQIQLLVNAVDKTADAEFGRLTKQRPLWLNDNDETRRVVQTFSQEEFFDTEERRALPSFNSLTIESQLYNVPSDVDRFFAMSDDMLLGRHHAASDIYSPLFGPTLGFKSNGYNIQSPPGEADARRFGEKPYLIYTSWMLNRRFGIRKRKGQAHFGHSMSRSIAREVRDAFPRPSLKSACQRFRGETGFQLYTWYAVFHYTMERHREALLYWYVMLRSDTNGDGSLDWTERSAIVRELEQGMEQEGNGGFGKRMFYRVAEYHREAGLQPPKVNIDTQWTSLDGPFSIRDIECYAFDVNECLAPGFSAPSSDSRTTSPVFNTAVVFDRVARQDPRCGDCLLKLILNRRRAGLEPLLPPSKHMPDKRALVLKALKRYQYTIVEPDALFVMVTDAEQVDNVLVNRLLRGVEGGKREVGQLCLNDDVETSNVEELAAVQNSIMSLFRGLLPEPSAFEKEAEAN